MNIEYSKAPECSFSCEFFRHDHIGTSQETPFVIACGSIDYLCFGNVKFNDISLTLRDQGTYQNDKSPSS